MLVAISGSQGSGKSTTINALKEKGHPVIERKTSRSILNEWGVTLKQVNDDPELTIKFQDVITQRKFDDEQEAMRDDKVWFTERTHTDLFTYALVSLGKDNTYSDWLNKYYELCKKFNNTYSKVFYLTAGHFTIEHDGVRGSNKHYSKMVDLVMLDFTREMVDDNALVVIDMPDLTERLASITWGIENITK